MVLIQLSFGRNNITGTQKLFLMANYLFKYYQPQTSLQAVSIMKLKGGSWRLYSILCFLFILLSHTK